jgi:membrane-associated protease RseP (regulator of RpoE activity)
MRRDWWRPLAVGLSVLTIGSFGGRAIRADDEAKGLHDLVIRLAEPAEVHGELLVTASHYRIGVKCAPAGEALRAQLPELPKDQGLLVEQVIPDGPAAKAGIKDFDLFVSVGDKPLGQVADLTNAIESAKGAELTIKLLRAGKPIAVTVKPEEQQPQGEPLRIPFGADKETVENWVKKFELAPQAGLDGHQLRLLTDGTIDLGHDLGQRHDLPADLSVNIYREGKKPAKITVKKREKQWVVYENELAQLPEDIRREVEPLLGGPIRIELKDLTKSVPLAGPPLGDVLVRPGDSVDRIEKRLDEMRKQFDEMRSTIDQLREQHRSQNSGAAEKKSESPRQ